MRWILQWQWKRRMSRNNIYKHTASRFVAVGAVFFPPDPFVFEIEPGKSISSRGTMSMRKSNWSDLLRALAMSDLDRVRRLFESAIIKALAVISEINTKSSLSTFSEWIDHYKTYSRMPCRTGSELFRRQHGRRTCRSGSSTGAEERTRTVSSYHLIRLL